MQHISSDAVVNGMDSLFYTDWTLGVYAGVYDRHVWGKPVDSIW